MSARVRRIDEIAAVGKSSDAETCYGAFGFLLTFVRLSLLQALTTSARPHNAMDALCQIILVSSSCVLVMA